MANHKLHVLRKVRPMLTTFSAQQIYKVMILPLIEYGNILYGGSKKCLLTKLQTVQNKCLKLAHHLPLRTPQKISTHYAKQARWRSGAGTASSHMPIGKLQLDFN